MIELGLGMGMDPGPYSGPVGPDPNLRIWVQLFQTLMVRVWVQVNFLRFGSGSCIFGPRPDPYTLNLFNKYILIFKKKKQIDFI